MRNIKSKGSSTLQNMVNVPNNSNKVQPTWEIPGKINSWCTRKIWKSEQLKVNNRNTRKMKEITSKLRIKTSEQRHFYPYGFFIVNFEQIKHMALVFPLFFWASECWLDICEAIYVEKHWFLYWKSWSSPWFAWIPSTLWYWILNIKSKYLEPDYQVFIWWISTEVPRYLVLLKQPFRVYWILYIN